LRRGEDISSVEREGTKGSGGMALVSLTLLSTCGKDSTKVTDLCFQAALGTTSHFHHKTGISPNPSKLGPLMRLDLVIGEWSATLP
jgi:hypothetical protein